MIPVYGYALGDEAVHAFTALRPRQRIKILACFDRLAKSPHQNGDYQESGGGERIYQVKLIDEVLITWWTDHAAREVRVVRIESAE